MLAKTMMTADELRISEKERQGLMVVRDLLRTGAIEDWRPLCEATRKFDMMCSMSSCGTVGCIGGWLAVQLGMSYNDADTYVQAHAFDISPFNELFYCPGLTNREIWGITGVQAAKAIDNFLETGKPRWEEVLA